MTVDPFLSNSIPQLAAKFLMLSVMSSLTATNKFPPVLTNSKISLKLITLNSCTEGANKIMLSYKYSPYFDRVSVGESTVKNLRLCPRAIIKLVSD